MSNSSSYIDFSFETSLRLDDNQSLLLTTDICSQLSILIIYLFFQVTMWTFTGQLERWRFWVKRLKSKFSQGREGYEFITWVLILLPPRFPGKEGHFATTLPGGLFEPYCTCWGGLIVPDEEDNYPSHYPSLILKQIIINNHIINHFLSQVR